MPADAPIDLFMTEVEQFGGAERSVLALARWLHEQGKPARLLCYEDRCDMASHAGFPLSVRVLQPGAGVVNKVKALRQVLRTRAAGTPPILTSGYQPALHLTLAGAGRFHCLMHDTPALFSGADRPTLTSRLRIGISNALIGYGMRRGAGAMIVTSEFLRGDCRRQFGVDAVIARMGGLGAPHGFQRRRAMVELRLLSVCRIEANKRIDWMLESLAELEGGATPLSGEIDWRLDLAGRGSQLEAMRARAGELGLAGRVVFHGFVPDEALETLYDRAHAFLMPAVQGYGIPAIEALERGIPVLLHRDSGVSDILLDTPWAVVLECGQEQMTPALRRLVALVRSDTVLQAPEPVLPTEAGWAEQVARVCGYVA